MGKKEKILQKIIKVVDKNVPDSEVYLYGSQARENANKLSDWDLLILLNRSSISFYPETKFMNEFYDLELETKHKLGMNPVAKVHHNRIRNILNF